MEEEKKTEEEIKDEKDEKYLDALTQIHDLTETVNNVVSEIKEMRNKPHEKKEEEKKEEPTDVDGKITEKLNSFQNATISKNKERALKKLYSEYKEFDPENDPTGLKRKEFEKNLERVNLTGLVDVEDFTEAFEFTIKGMGIDPSAKKEEIINPYSSTQRDGGKPKSNDADDIILTASEKAMAKGLGISEEKLKERLKNRRKK